MASITQSKPAGAISFNSRGRVLVCRHAVGRPQLASDLQAVGVGVHGDDGLAAMVAGQLQEQQPQRAGAKEENAIIRSRSEAPEPVQRAGQRLRQGGHGVGKGLAGMEIRRRRAHVFGKAARPVQPDDSGILAQVRSTLSGRSGIRRRAAPGGWRRDRRPVLH